MPRITSITVYIAEDTGPEDEGVMAFMTPQGTWMPLVAADEARADSLLPIAREISKLSGKPFKKVRFNLREELPTDG